MTTIPTGELVSYSSHQELNRDTMKRYDSIKPASPAEMKDNTTSLLLDNNVSLDYLKQLFNKNS